MAWCQKQSTIIGGQEMKIRAFNGVASGALGFFDVEGVR
jgi:hypothetical protein